MAAPDTRILDAFRNSLLSAINRSPLMKLDVKKTGRLLDLIRLDVLRPGLEKSTLQTLISGESAKIEFSWRFSVRDEKDDPERKPSEQELIEGMLTRIIRAGIAAKRETGSQTIWLGYPLLHVVNGDGDSLKQLFAPIFLWPINISQDRRRAEQYVLDREGPPQYNRAMAVWIMNTLGLDLRGPGEDDLDSLTWEDIPPQIELLRQGFRELPAIDFEKDLEPIPAVKTLKTHRTPRLFHSAVLGNFRWQNERLLADINALKDIRDFSVPVSGYISGKAIDQKPEHVPLPSEEDRFLVFDADFSQENTVWQARQKPGLVVHGPPGTGKSQTIVNIIADALAHQLTVLMVCQKQAATHVVLERLRKVDLADLCMEVHDAELERKAVFQQIHDQVVSLSKTPAPTNTQEERQRLAGQILSLKRDLDAIAKGLHEKHPEIELSYRTIQARSGRLQLAFPNARSLLQMEAVVWKLSAHELSSVRQSVEATARWFKSAEPFDNPWRNHQPTLDSQDPITEKDVRDTLARLAEQDHAYQALVREGPPIPRNIDLAANTARDFLVRFKDLSDDPDFERTNMVRHWIVALRGKDPNVIHVHRKACAEAATLSALAQEPQTVAACETHFSSLSDSELKILCQSAEVVLANKDRWFVARWWNGYSPAAVAIRELGESGTVAELATMLIAYSNARINRYALAQKNESLVPGVMPDRNSTTVQTQFPAMAAESLEVAVFLLAQERMCSFLKPPLDAFSQRRTTVIEIQDLQAFIQKIDSAKKMIDALARMELFLLPEGLKQPEADIRAGKSIRPWIESLSARFNSLSSLMLWEFDRRQRQPPVREILECLEGYEQGRAKGQTLPVPPSDLSDDRYGEWWWALVETTAVKSWLTMCREKHPALLQFDPEQHEKKREQLKGFLQQKRLLEPKRIQEVWIARQHSVKHEPWTKFFQLRGKNSKRLRQAIEVSLPKGLLNLRPCWLTDPDTAAQIFPLQAGLFDVVIFDEASQCPIEYAVPAIFRGRSVIVSGDGKQLPPTSFFSTRSKADQDEEDEQDEDSTDITVSQEDKALRQINAEFLTGVEDLLEASIGNLPSTRLLVHYRSDHPDLIQFSNRAFYLGQLEAPPARMNANGVPPIEYRYLGDGIYHDRTNRREAQEIVQLLKGIWSSAESPTVGVVTFNQPQREMIEDLIAMECKSDAAFDARYQQEILRKEDKQDVGFFVKNLENVQGDERDMMIFSTTFGPGGDGRFLRRFGPVGSERGERRLNVAVTRAKKRIVIVSSMPIDKISESLGAGASPGMNLKPRCYLQLYLAYARAISSGDREEVQRILTRLSRGSSVLTTQAGPESPLEEEVLSELQKLGLDVDCQVGEEGFRIDLAIRSHKPELGYLLGIECDGAMYHSDRAAHLRDVWRESILRDRGWRLYRIWSTRWWHHRLAEMARLKEAINWAIAQTPNLETSVRRTPTVATSSEQPGLYPQPTAPPRVDARPAVFAPVPPQPKVAPAKPKRALIKSIHVRTGPVSGTEVRFDLDNPPESEDREALRRAGFQCKGAQWAWITTNDMPTSKARLNAEGFRA